ncbi:MAG: DMT family transporter [Candidatus Hermodarchaeota archaeon]
MVQQRKKEVIAGPVIVATANAMRALDAPVRYPLILKNFELPLNDPIVPSRSAFIVLVEHIIGTVLVVLLLFSRKAHTKLISQLKSFNSRDWISFFLVSLGSGLGLYFFLLALAYGNPTIAILLQKSQPLITLAFAMIILKEKPSKYYYSSLVIAIVGIFLLVAEEIAEKTTTVGFFGTEISTGLLAAFFSLIAAAFWGSNTVWGRILTEKVDYWNLTTIRYIGGSLILIFFNIIVGAYTNDNFNMAGETIITFGVSTPFLSSPIQLLIPINAIIAIILLTIFTGGVIPLGLYYFGLRWSKASVGGLAELAFPLLAIFINYLFLGFGLTLIQILGAIILLGVVSIMSYVNAKEHEKELSI